MINIINIISFNIEIKFKTYIKIRHNYYMMY